MKSWGWRIALEPWYPSYSRIMWCDLYYAPGIRSFKAKRRLCLFGDSNKSDLRSVSEDPHRHSVVNKGRANLTTPARECRTGTCCSLPIGCLSRQLQLTTPPVSYHWLMVEVVALLLTPFVAAPVSCQLWGGKITSYSLGGSTALLWLLIGIFAM